MTAKNTPQLRICLFRRTCFFVRCWIFDHDFACRVQIKWHSLCHYKRIHLNFEGFTITSHSLLFTSNLSQLSPIVFGLYFLVHWFLAQGVFVWKNNETLNNGLLSWRYLYLIDKRRVRELSDKWHAMTNCVNHIKDIHYWIYK